MNLMAREGRHARRLGWVRCISNTLGMDEKKEWIDGGALLVDSCPVL